MKKNNLFLLLLMGFMMNAQNHEDAKRLSQLEYMKMINIINCDNNNGSTIEDRVCLNLEFQKVDALLNQQLIIYLNQIKIDSLHFKVKNYQENWVLNRRLQSELFSEGLNGNFLGIYYLRSMISSTELRIKELELLIKK